MRVLHPLRRNPIRNLVRADDSGIVRLRNGHRIAHMIEVPMRNEDEIASDIPRLHLREGLCVRNGSISSVCEEVSIRKQEWLRYVIFIASL